MREFAGQSQFIACMAANRLMSYQLLRNGQCEAGLQTALNLHGGELFRDRHHYRERLFPRNLLGCTQKICDGIVIKVALIEGRWISAIEEPTGVSDFEVDLDFFEPVLPTTALGARDSPEKLGKISNLHRLQFVLGQVVSATHGGRHFRYCLRT